MGGVIPQANDGIGLRSFLALNDVELHVIALLQGLVALQLYRRVMNENVWPVITSDESVALGVVEPLHLTFELSHRLPPSLHREEYTAAEKQIRILDGRYLFMTAESGLRLVACEDYLFKTWDAEGRGTGNPRGTRDRRDRGTGGTEEPIWSGRLSLETGREWRDSRLMVPAEL